ncbi:MAG: hypothetical protein Ta2B_22310 [Termitinemataceae bacterium]|nr:MAG: hypothetical protein Ta2B_22310 [Termitinemataceae bacterium]
MKLFIFDMGGVVVGNVAVVSQIASMLGITDNEFYKAAGSDEGSLTSPYNLGDIGAIMRGDIDGAEFWRRFTKRSGIVIKGNPWRDCFKPVIKDDTIALINDLRAAAYRVVCGTNTLDAHYQSHLERGDYKHFDAVYASHLMHVIKPDPAFWQHILAAENCSAACASFTDDAQENIDAATKLGIKAYLFNEAADLRAAISIGDESGAVSNGLK